MLTKKKIEICLKALNEKLKAENIKGELCLYGGAVMCLAYNARPMTKDVDAVFEPASKIRKAAVDVSKELHVSRDWLNDGVKGFLVKHKKKKLYDWSNLKVYIADPYYLLAMKCLASRVDSKDRSDIEFLIRKLKIKTLEPISKRIKRTDLLGANMA